MIGRKQAWMLLLAVAVSGTTGSVRTRAAPVPPPGSPNEGVMAYDGPPDRTSHLTYPPDGPDRIAVSPAGDLIASGVTVRMEGGVRRIRLIYGAVLWNPRTGKRVRVLEKPRTPESDLSRTLAFSPDGKRLASGNAAGNVTLWNLHTGAVEHTLQVSKDRVVEQIAFSPNGKTLAAGTNSGDVQLWNVSTGNLERTLKGLYSLDAICFSPDGALLAAGCGVSVAAFTPDIRKLKIGVLKNGEGGPTREIGHLQVWNLGTGKNLWSDAGGPDHFVYTVAFSPDSQQLVSGGARLQAWAARTGAPQWTHEIPPSSNARGHFPSVAFAPRGGVLASTSSRYVKARFSGYTLMDDLELWDAATGRHLKTLATEKDINARLVAFAKDGSLLWCGEGDKEVTARVWRVSGK